MNLTVFKDNIQITEVNLQDEVANGQNERLSFLLGRSEDCVVQIDDKQISREQAEIIYENGSWRIKNISSVSSIYLNGQPVTEQILKNSDTLKIGSYSIIVGEITGFIEGEPSKEDTFLQSEEELEKEIAPEEDTLEISSGDVEEHLEKKLEDVLEEVEDEVLGEFSSVDENISPLEDIEEESLGDDDSFEEERGFAQENGELSDGGLDSFDEEDSEFPEEADGTEGFGFESEEDDQYDLIEDDVGEKTQVFSSFAKYSLDLFGELAPYDNYVLEKSEVVIGRDPLKCDVVLNDPEVSGEHAKLKQVGITLVLEDLNSGNGTLLNGQRINSSNLKHGDEFIVGETTFTVKMESELLAAQSERLMPVEEGQEIEVEEIIEVDEEYDEDGENVVSLLESSEAGGTEASEKPKSLLGKYKALPPDKKKKVNIGIILLVVLLVVMDGGEESTSSSPVAGVGKRKAKAKVKKRKGKCDHYTKAMIEEMDAKYELGKEYIRAGKFREAEGYLSSIYDCNYKKTAAYMEIVKNAIKELKEIEENNYKKAQQIKKMKEVKELVAQAKKAVDKIQMDLAKSLFSKILQKDPENIEVSRLQMEVDAYEKKKAAAELEKAAKESERKRQLAELAPGRSYYNKKEWYRAILKLDDFLKLEGMDEDLVKEGVKMMNESKGSLEKLVQPLIGKARSLKEGQDLKGAYEVYNEILSYDESNEESLNEMSNIRDQLYSRSRKIYREAIISESLSLFEDAKEKLQEVQQISPSDSDYYKKATTKLKEYIE